MTQTYETMFNFFLTHNKRNLHWHTISHHTVWQILKTLATHSFGQAVGKHVLSCTDDMNVNYHSLQGRQFLAKLCIHLYCVRLLTPKSLL